MISTRNVPLATLFQVVLSMLAVINAAAASETAGYELVQMVVVSRHGGFSFITNATSISR